MNPQRSSGWAFAHTFLDGHAVGEGCSVRSRGTRAVERPPLGGVLYPDSNGFLPTWKNGTVAAVLQPVIEFFLFCVIWGSIVSTEEAGYKYFNFF